MMHASPLAAGLMKETRALLPAWLACTLVVAAGAISRDRTVLWLGGLAYGLGSIVLGAQSIGYEYSYRTLGLLLSQPTDRRRLLLMKVAVLASMLATSTLLVWAVLFSSEGYYQARGWPEPHALLLVPVCSLFLAPWLTMVCRSALAAVVFTIAIPLSLLIVGDVIGIAKYGLGGVARIDSFKQAVFWWGTLLACAAAGVSAWRMFMRLEVIEGRDPEIEILQRAVGRDATTAQAIDVAPARGRHPVWLLAQKELRLQQITFVVAGLYILCWATLTLVKHFGRGLPEIPVGPLTILYFALLSILIGSLASAEERQYGTLEWHLLLPMPTAQQWAIKAGVALGLALLLGIGLPGVLSLINASANDLRGAPRLWREITLVVLALTTCSLYLSSLCTSGVRAMVLALPVALGASLYIKFIGSIVPSIIFRPAFDAPVRFLARALRGGQPPSPRTLTTLLLAMLPGLMVVLLRFAWVNHRSAERNVSRIVRQAVWIAVFLALGVLLLSIAFNRGNVVL